MHVGRSLLIAAAGAALAWPAAASAAPNVVATAVVGPPQDCQAGCIGSLDVDCAATDALAVQTTVRCWTQSYDVLTATKAGPVATVSSREYNPILREFTLCVEGIARYANGTTASSGVRCTTAQGAAVVVG